MAELGNGLDTALGAITSQLAAGKVGELANDIASGMSNDPETRYLLSSIIANTVSGAIGMAEGGETGANLASTLDRYNRQLHMNELARLKELAGDVWLRGGGLFQRRHVGPFGYNWGSGFL